MLSPVERRRAAAPPPSNARGAFRSDVTRADLRFAIRDAPTRIRLGIPKGERRDKNAIAARAKSTFLFLPAPPSLSISLVFLSAALAHLRVPRRDARSRG